MMDATTLEPAKAAGRTSTQRYAKCIDASKRVRWDIDRDVIRGRPFDFGRKFLPDGLSQAARPAVPRPARRAASSRRSRAAPTPTCSGSSSATSAPRRSSSARDHGMGDQVALEALVRFTDEELKHQELFRRLEKMAAAGMPSGLRLQARTRTTSPSAVLAKSTWAVLGLTLDIELFTQAHYRSSIEPRRGALASCGRTCSSSTGRRSRSTRSSTSSSGGARTRGSRPRSATRRWTTSSPSWARWTASCRCRPTADADYFLARAGRTFSAAEATLVHDTMLQGLPLAVHRRAACRSRASPKS